MDYQVRFASLPSPYKSLTLLFACSGNFSDYFSVGVNTGNGLSMLLIPRQEGVETKLIKTSCK